MRWNRSSTSCPIPVRTRSQSRGTQMICFLLTCYFEESITCLNDLFHRKPQALDSTRLWKLWCSFALETELGNLSGTPNSMFLWYLQLEFYHTYTSFQPICGDLWLSSTVVFVYLIVHKLNEVECTKVVNSGAIGASSRVHSPVPSKWSRSSVGK